MNKYAYELGQKYANYAALSNLGSWGGSGYADKYKVNKLDSSNSKEAPNTSSRLTINPASKSEGGRSNRMENMGLGSLLGGGLGLAASEYMHDPGVLEQLGLVDTNNVKKYMPALVGADLGALAGLLASGR